MIQDPGTLLDEARARGLLLIPLGDRLRVVGRLDDDLRRRLRASKPALLDLLREDWREAWEERAAILEHLAGLPRVEAERLATILHTPPTVDC